jgi:hypothetical protein
VNKDSDCADANLELFCHLFVGWYRFAIDRAQKGFQRFEYGGFESRTRCRQLNRNGAIGALVTLESAATGLSGWLKSKNPLWHKVGRVTFHLAENKRDPHHPFAFLATHTHRLSDQGKPQHLPLARALQEYAGAKNKAAN